MVWIIQHSADLGFALSIIVGICTVYIGIQMQRRRNLPSKVKLTSGEIVVSMLVLIAGLFVLGINAVRTYGGGHP